jgi:hypothetical protein
MAKWYGDLIDSPEKMQNFLDSKNNFGMNTIAILRALQTLRLIVIFMYILLIHKTSYTVALNLILY